MCFGSKLKGEDPSSRMNEQIRPVQSQEKRTSSRMPQDYAPPSGAPLSHQYQSPDVTDYSAPSGPPPTRSNDDYRVPSGPPPNQSVDDYAPPSGPPPNQEPYHDWQTAVPDTSLLPPPPSFFSGNQRSRTNNATEVQAEQGEAWCQSNPMTAPADYPEAALEAMASGQVGVMKPRSYAGALDRLRPGVWAGKTKNSCPDSCITSSIPLYSVLAHSPLRTGKRRTIYYEVRIDRRNRKEVSLAIGFSAPPYPTFRLPGWHRGSLAVHGDDGSKFINDRWGGKDFTTPFKPGEVIGLGMSFEAAPPGYGGEKPKEIEVEIFLTRDGVKAGGWNLHEEGDAVEDLPVTGLEGLNDLCATVGVFEGVDFEIVFNSGEWLYHP